MKDFFSRIKAKVLVGVLVLLAAMMAYAGANNRLTTAPQEVIGLLLTPLQRAAAGVKNSADSLADRYTRIDEILEENEQLREENNALEQKLLEQQPLFSEILPLTLEEIFISETEVAGYDVRNLIY